MMRIPRLSTFLGIEPRHVPFYPGAAAQWLAGRHCRTVVTWGRKDRENRAARFALTCQLPLLRMEDGFLRSLDLGARGAAPLSLVVDTTGMYYDATGPSDLENVLRGTGWESPAVLAEGRELLDFVLEHNLSKYNHAPDADPALLPDRGRPRVLVLDQTAGDLSVTLGMADASTFAAMLECALSEHPGADIYVKTHPDVLAGKKKGFLTHAARAGVTLLAEDVNPLTLLRQTDEVYTVSSQMGFEALLLGKTVHCFGMPFYAGWGLTRDRQTCPRRTRRRTVEEVFAAAYVRYARYVHPATGERCSALEAARILAEQRQCNERRAGFHACVGFDRWKHPHARAFLHSTRGGTEFFKDTGRAVRAAVRRKGRVVVWASREQDDLAQACHAASVPLWRMEDGFLRSVGLGSDYHRPGSLVLDDVGMYYDPARPSRLEQLLAEDVDASLLAQAADLRRDMVARGITKYNVGDRADLPDIPAGKAVVLVPGQVEDDASVRKGGCGIYSNLALLREVRLARPQAFLIYKEHPDVVRGNRPGTIVREQALALADAVVCAASMQAVLPLCHEVHTLTSLTGFEALLRGIPVWTYGGPFYAGWGLTHDRVRFVRRKPLPSVDHLVAGTLLRYAAYYDWKSRGFLDGASFVRVLALQLTKGSVD